jgi:replicative superfamily II helicase
MGTNLMAPRRAEMTEPSALRQELDRLKELAAEAGSDRERVVEVLQEASRLQQPVEDWRNTVRSLVEQALLAGVKPQDLYGKPYTAAYVRMIYNDLRKEGHDLPVMKLGPRPR